MDEQFRKLEESLPDKNTELRKCLTLEQFPRAAAYDPTWVLTNLMGPNPQSIKMLRADAGCAFGFTRVVAHKRADRSSINRSTEENHVYPTR
jgi:hypothetical protein